MKQILRLPTMLILGLFLLIVIPGLRQAGAAVKAGTEELRPEKRLEVLESLWRNLSATYPALEYKGIQGREWIEPAVQRVNQAKSDQDFYDILLEQMASLKDTHTRIISYPGQPKLEMPPVMVNQVEGKVAVIRAHPDTTLSPGETILSIEQRPVEECLAEQIKRVSNSTERGRVREACGQLLRGSPGTTVTVSVQGTNGAVRQVALRRESRPDFWLEPVITSRRLSDSIGYIRISRWTDDTIPEQFDQALETFKETQGIIIDVRGNGGGNDQLADLVNGRLIAKPVVSSIDFWRKQGRDQYQRTVGWVQPRGPWTYRGRVAVLIDEASMSACEHFVSGIEAMGFVLLVGVPTNGAGGGPTIIKLPDGTRVTISRALGLRANGVVFEGHGIPPHIYSEATLSDLRAGRDGALNIARDWILSGRDVPARSQLLPGRIEDSGAQRPSEGTATAATQLPQKKSYDTSLSIAHMDISLKTDFQSNNVWTVVKAALENTSPQAVERAEFWLCSGHGNAEGPRADVKHVYLLESDGRKDLQFTIHKSEDKEKKGDQWAYYQITLPETLQPGQKCWLQFEYTMTGKPDHSSSPILQTKEGFREIYLRGGDYVWCPKPYCEVNKEGIDPRLRDPTWTLRLEYPVGYVAVTDGTQVRREEKDGFVKNEWKSLVPGTPKLLVGQYKVARRTEGGMTVELYASDEKRLNVAAEKLEKYARIYRLYAELFGDPEQAIYRIVGSDVVPIASSFISGQFVEAYQLEDIHLVAHEMAHVWWGWGVRVHGPGWKFLSEAMAEFSARWILQVMGEQENMMKSLSDDWIRIMKYMQFSMFFAGSELPSGFSCPLILQEGYDHIWIENANYKEGPLVVNHIRLILGDKVFFKCLRAFLRENRGEQVGIDEFVRTINAVSGKDLTAEFKGLLWTTGFASYRLAGFISERAESGYRTKVRIQNEGDYGVTCPLLLKTVGGEQRAVFKVEAKQEKEFVFTTAYRVLDMLIDPDMTTLTQYHPEQKVRLWMKLKAFNANEYAGKAYMHYALGDSRKAVETMSEYLEGMVRRQKVPSVEELLKKDASDAPFVFMRGVFHLASGDHQKAEEDIRSAFPFMLRAVSKGEIVSVPSVYYEVGAIAHNDLGEYLTLLSVIGGREFAFESGLDESSKKKVIQKWVESVEKEGKQPELDLGRLRERFEAQRRAFCEREVSLRQTAGTPLTIDCKPGSRSFNLPSAIGNRQ